MMITFSGRRWTSWGPSSRSGIVQVQEQQTLNVIVIFAPCLSWVNHHLLESLAACLKLQIVVPWTRHFNQWGGETASLGKSHTDLLMFLGRQGLRGVVCRSWTSWATFTVVTRCPRDRKRRTFVDHRSLIDNRAIWLTFLVEGPFWLRDGHSLVFSWLGWLGRISCRSRGKTNAERFQLLFLDGEGWRPV